MLTRRSENGKADPIAALFLKESSDLDRLMVEN
jgi:hypothetical protein